jgi:hypothetical protein
LDRGRSVGFSLFAYRLQPLRTLQQSGPARHFEPGLLPLPCDRPHRSEHPPGSYPIEALEETLGEGIITGHPDMPEFRFESNEAGAIIAYLKSIQERKSRSQPLRDDLTHPGPPLRAPPNAARSV